MKEQETDGNGSYKLVIEPVADSGDENATTNKTDDLAAEQKASKADGGKSAAMPTLKEAILEQASEDDITLSTARALRKILGGDLLNTSTIRRQIWLCLLITFFMLVYTGNRYSCQKQLIEIDKLTKELQDIKYKSLSSSSQITEKSRESHVLRMLRNNRDTTLRMPEQPPYIISVPEE